MPLLPAQSIRVARERDCSCLVCFSTMYFDRRSTGAEVGRYERIVFLYSLSGVLFLFVGTVIFWSILGLVDSC